jgi:hypothetical protein
MQKMSARAMLDTLSSLACAGFALPRTRGNAPLFLLFPFSHGQALDPILAAIRDRAEYQFRYIEFPGIRSRPFVRFRTGPGALHIGYLELITFDGVLARHDHCIFLYYSKLPFFVEGQRRRTAFGSVRTEWEIGRECGGEGERKTERAYGAKGTGKS